MSTFLTTIKAIKTPRRSKAKGKIDPLLFDILSDKRPTKDPLYCLTFMKEILNKLDIDYMVDLARNITVAQGESDCCFTAHTDTMNSKLGKSDLVITPDGILSVKDGGVLGADDGSGIYIMLKMILAGKPGLFVFFSQEEMGRVGSLIYIMPTHISKCVSFDRKGTDHLITHQMSEKGCSKDFSRHFIDEFPLDFVEDPTGSFTDSYSFFESVSECVNVSVGYYDQHSKQETQDVPFLESMVLACIDMDWEALPSVRVPEPTPTWGKYYGVQNYWRRDEADELEGEMQEMEEFVYKYPEATTRVLWDYGISLRDLKMELDSNGGIYENTL